MEGYTIIFFIKGGIIECKVILGSLSTDAIVLFIVLIIVMVFMCCLRLKLGT